MAAPSARRLVGSLGLLIFVIIYTLVAMWFGATVVNAQGKWIQLIYYVIAGLAWAVPAYAIILWSSKSRN